MRVWCGGAYWEWIRHAGVAWCGAWGSAGFGRGAAAVSCDVLCVGRANVCCCKECRMSGGLGGSCVGEDGVGWGEVCGDVVWGGVLWGGVQRGGVG